MLDFPKLGFSEILGEARLLGEYLRFRGDTLRERASEISGDPRPVLLIPGFMAGDASLYPLGARLRSDGHQVFYAGIWMNADCPAKTLERLSKRIHEVSLQTELKVVIVGHSLGGLYARELARRETALVEQVFLLGSPIKRAAGNTTPFLRPLVAAMRAIHRDCIEDGNDSCRNCGLNLPAGAPSVPEICIYSKTDGIVEWHSCLDEGPLVECVEVDSSHCGIPLNLKTWDEIRTRLSRPAQPTRPLRVETQVTRMRALPPRTPHRSRASHHRLTRRNGTAA